MEEAEREPDSQYEGVTDHETDEGPIRWRVSFPMVTGCFCDGWSDSTIYET